jgi:hypothetical protein
MFIDPRRLRAALRQEGNVIDPRRLRAALRQGQEGNVIGH